MQLPPVIDSPIYNLGKNKKPAAEHGYLVWKLFDAAIELQAVVRQDADQKELREALDAMRNYELTEKQAEWLQNFQWFELKQSHGQPLLDRMMKYGLHVFPTHKEEEDFNHARLVEINKTQPVATMTAKSEPRRLKAVEPC